MRESCHQLVANTQKWVCELTGFVPLHPQTDTRFAQMAAAPLPPATDITTLKQRLYDEYRIEVPVLEWSASKLIQISAQGFNTKRDIDKLIRVLLTLLSD